METAGPLLRKAQQYLRSAALLLEMGDFDSCVSRSYFAMFYAARAALAGAGVSHSATTGLRTAFVERFIENGPFPKRAGEALHAAYEAQQTADYAPRAVTGEADAERLLQEAEAFVNSTEQLARAR